MGQLFAWSLVSSLTLLAMYIVYKWLLAAENQHAFNRVALLAIYAAAIFAPFILRINFSPQPAGEIEMDAIMVDFAEAATPVAPETSLLPVIALWIYVAGIIVVLLSTVVVFVRLIQLVSSGERRQLSGGYILVLTDNSKVAPFSWRRYIVMSYSDWKEAGGIIARHEMRHISACHWLDLLLAQAVVALQWYNPAAWLMREELKTVHEYQADEAVITSGSEINEYQMLLIKKAVGARFPSLANSLNHSKLKKRITMMYKNRSSAGRRMRSLALLPAFAATLLVAFTPAAKSLINDASEATLEISGNKGSENSQETITIHSSEIESAVETGNLADEKVYIDGELKDLDALEKLKNSDIESVRVEKSSNSVYIETKRNNTETTETSMSSGQTQDSSTDKKFYINDELKDETALHALNNSDIEIIYADAIHNKVIVYTKDYQSDSKKEALAASEKADNSDAVDAVAPEFPGGMGELIKFVQQHLRYPESAAKAGIQGRVVVTLTVGEDGKVSNPEVRRSASEELDAEAVRVLMSLPAFIPAQHLGKPVSTHITIPVNFRLSGSDDEEEEEE